MRKNRNKSKNTNQTVNEAATMQIQCLYGKKMSNNFRIKNGFLNVQFSVHLAARQSEQDHLQTNDWKIKNATKCF